MKLPIRSVAFLSSLIAGPLFAGSTTVLPSSSSGATVSTTSDSGTLSYEFDLEDGYVGEGDVTRGPRSVRDFDENNFLARFLLLPRTKIGILRLGAAYERYDFDIPSFAQLPDLLHSANLIVGLDTELSDSFLIRIEASPGFYSAGDLNSKDFMVPFIAGASWIYNSNLQFVFGVGVNFDSRYPVLPGGGIRWRINSQWVLDAVMPKPRLEFEATKNFTVYAGAEIKSGTYRVSNDFGDLRGIDRLNDAVISYSEVRAGIGVEWKLTSALRLGIEGGYQPYREFDYHRANVRYKEDGGAPYGTVGLHAAF